MSDTPWTPGPWVWQAEEECLVGPHFVVMRQDNEGRKVFADYPDGTTQANARLIAAAPDLYDALDAAIDLIEGDLTGLEWKQACREFVTSARAIVAKAKGATP